MNEGAPCVFPSPTVFRTLVAQILDRPEPLLPPSLASEVVTVFQFHGYFSGPGVGSLEGHVRQLAGQGGLLPGPGWWSDTE